MYPQGISEHSSNNSTGPVFGMGPKFGPEVGWIQPIMSSCHHHGSTRRTRTLEPAPYFWPVRLRGAA